MKKSLLSTSKDLTNMPCDVSCASNHNFMINKFKSNRRKLFQYTNTNFIETFCHLSNDIYSEEKVRKCELSCCSFIEIVKCTTKSFQ